MPKTAAFTGFTLDGNNSSKSNEFNVNGSYNSGWNFYTKGWYIGGTIFFDALGWRGSSSGYNTLLYVGTSTYYWTNGASSLSYARDLYSVSSKVASCDIDPRSCGLTVRPVLE